LLADLLDRRVLVCPDDRTYLIAAQGGLRCETCGRHFPLLAERVVELLPTRAGPGPLGNELYSESYHDSRAEAFAPNEETAPWADPARVGERALEVKARHVEWIKQRLLAAGDGAGLVLCDMSAGPGYYTFEYARSFGCVLHCDLSARALSYAERQARERKLDNVVFLRIDYLRPPFHRSLDRLICFDTLIRGRQHDLALLRAIVASLRPGGEALVDFHNWWHNPIRRIGLLPDNFVGNTSYRRSRLRSLLREADVPAELEGYFAELRADDWYAPLMARVLPATRHTLTVRTETG
jgi:SAM-dependent methyltransferase/uncharacterized protein YbaR (Trm112 family)